MAKCKIYPRELTERRNCKSRGCINYYRISRCKNLQNIKRRKLMQWKLIAHKTEKEQVNRKKTTKEESTKKVKSNVYICTAVQVASIKINYGNFIRKEKEVYNQLLLTLKSLVIMVLSLSLLPICMCFLSAILNLSSRKLPLYHYQRRSA